MFDLNIHLLRSNDMNLWWVYHKKQRWLQSERIAIFVLVFAATAYPVQCFLLPPPISIG